MNPMDEFDADEEDDFHNEKRMLIQMMYRYHDMRGNNPEDYETIIVRPK